ncbi:uncharacterized protein LOC135492022 isoform X2 [Lineus longissimus]|uniref:uncharacterized protein LOC135492022 isoform X2 n=1 Tax=Lineus longissimus TaxID=88925 RepID=UPI00315DD14F
MGKAVSKEELANDMLERIVDKSQYEGLRKDYVYENLAFEGGGAKGVGYCGAVKALEDLGILKKIKRFAGTSIGSLSAMIMAVGGGANDMAAESLENLDNLVSDSCKGSLLVNIFAKFGWHPGRRLLDYLKERVKHFTGNPNLTFKQLYDKRGVELCVIVTNISTCNIEYCHLKTTPDLPIVIAVKMSMTLPIMFQPEILFDPIHNQKHVFIDGGLCLNYPVTVFDGWFLSTEPKDSFFHKIGSDMDVFKPINEKSLGMKVFDAFENESDELTYLGRYGVNKPKRPDTALSEKKGKLVDHQLAEKERKLRMIDAAARFLKFLGECDKTGSGTVSLPEFKTGLTKALKLDSRGNDEFDLLDWAMLFDNGPLAGKSIEEIFAAIDADNDQQIEFPELLAFMSKNGVPLRQMMMRGCPRTEIDSIGSFVGNVIETFTQRIRALTSSAEEPERSIGVYTDYVGTTDMAMSIEDKEYVAKLGWLAAIGFFKHLNKDGGKYAKAPEIKAGLGAIVAEAVKEKAEEKVETKETEMVAEAVEVKKEEAAAEVEGEEAAADVKGEEEAAEVKGEEEAVEVKGEEEAAEVKGEEEAAEVRGEEAAAD